MARRRRSLLGARGAIPGGPSSAEGAEPSAEATPDDDVPVPTADEPAAEEPAADLPATEEPAADAPAAEPAAEPSPPVEPVPEPPAGDSLPEVSEPPEQPSFQPLTGYQQVGGADAPVAEDLFGEGGYDDFDGNNPPTEEMPTGVMEDVGQPYNAPYTVPEPPPIPGILDRFTPPPAQRTNLGARRRKPDYLADTPSSPDRYEPTPAPPRRRAVRPEDDPVAVRRGAPIGLAVVILGLGLGAVGVGAIVLGLGMMLSSGSGAEEGMTPIDATDGEITAGGVEVRSNMQRKPGLIGVDEQPSDALPPVPGAAGASPTDPALPSPGAPTPSPAPQKAVPSPAPAPRPHPRTAPAATTPAAAKGTLKIRSNRRVLVYVNGQAIGYTPQDYAVSPGTFTVSAMVPGQPNTKQTRDAVVSAVGTTVPVDFTF